MAVKTVNIKIEESDFLALEKAANAFHMSVTDLVQNSIHEYIEELKKEPIYRLTANIQNADEAESAEILTAVESLSDDDLTISSSRMISQ